MFKPESRFKASQSHGSLMALLFLRTLLAQAPTRTRIVVVYHYRNCNKLVCGENENINPCKLVDVS